MKTDADPELSARMAAKSDEELAGMFGRAREWREEALEAARVELMRRGEPVPEREEGNAVRAGMPWFKLVCLGLARVMAGLLVAIVGGIVAAGIFGSSGPEVKAGVITVGVVGILGWAMVVVARGARTVVRGMVRGMREAAER